MVNRVCGKVGKRIGIDIAEMLEIVVFRGEKKLSGKTGKRVPFGRILTAETNGYRAASQADEPGRGRSAPASTRNPVKITPPR